MPRAEADGPHVTASLGGGRDGVNGAGRLARAVHDRKTLDNGCPAEMAPVDQRTGRFCVDRWEATLLDVLPGGDTREHSPFFPVGANVVRAVSRPNVFPQGYISAVEAQQACLHAGKRLCKPSEWRKACLGPDTRIYGYGNRAEPKRCNDHGRSPILATFGPQAFAPGRHAWDFMNTPSLNQLDDTLAKTGDHPGCTNGYGVYDMVGNLHEWVADPNGTFFGGYYQDTKLHGEGCTYTTSAHAASYHDYSTGFRCCADAQ
jgi:sulfatase modifying factor 1